MIFSYNFSFNSKVGRGNPSRCAVFVDKPMKTFADLHRFYKPIVLGPGVFCSQSCSVFALSLFGDMKITLFCELVRLVPV